MAKSFSCGLVASALVALSASSGIAAEPGPMVPGIAFPKGCPERCKHDYAAGYLAAERVELPRLADLAGRLAEAERKRQEADDVAMSSIGDADRLRAYAMCLRNARQALAFGNLAVSAALDRCGA